MEDKKEEMKAQQIEECKIENKVEENQSLESEKNESESKKEEKHVKVDETPVLERIYTIKLGKVYEKPRTKRARYAILLIKKFVEKHFRVEKDDIYIDQKLNEKIWERGIKYPPRKIRVLISKYKDGKVKVSLLVA